MKTSKTGKTGRTARLSLAQIGALLARQQASGLTLSAFGRQEGVPIERLTYYRRRLRLAQCEPQHPPARAADAPAQPAGFVRLEPPADQASPAAADTAPVFLHCPGGARLEVRPGFDPTLVLDLVQLLTTRLLQTAAPAPASRVHV